MIPIEMFEAIRKAIEVLQMNQGMKRLDGHGWSVYWVGKQIRVDIQWPEKEN